ncbi:MAG: ATP-binding cassette domain-containing protein [Gemmatimonadaceae bacterium]|nr:ATP-binding cassette domain-containing protein [Gemmatimonadaceae bacterium]
MTYALVADCVSKAFGHRRVLSSASLRAKRGEVRAIFGRNGEGKSTLLKIATGLLQPDAGTVRMGDTVFTRASLPMLAARGVFYLPDHDVLAPVYRLGMQLGLFERRFGQGRAIDAARLAGIDHLLDRRVVSLSGGELRRAELALAITRSPTVLIADEPYRGIAPVDHDRLTTLFRTMAAGGCAVVVTGHEVPSLLAAADHVTWCTSGTTYELGSASAACAHDGFRRGYLGPTVRAPG